ncbi:hypothetical protein V6N11_045288 [Hibiscus sabdariffa]|uniref:Uncharacterized protein n=1 Tax=Hibiscus sabdariffa TaxID=183260 RepID=A0ABR2Q0G7_9ROSI
MVDLVSEIHAATSEVVAVGVAVSADRVSNMWKVDAVAGVEVATMGESVPASPNQGWKTLFLGLPLPFHAPVEVNVWVDVLTTYDLPSSITVDLGNSTYVDVGVQLDWAPPCCSSCSVFGHATDKCRKTIVQEGAKFVGVSSGNSAGVVGEIGFNIGAKASSCPVIMDPIGDVVCGVDRQQENDVVSTIVVGSDDVGLCVRDEGVPSSNHGGVLSPNKFDALCDVVEEQIQVGTLRPCRVAATGVADLIPEI